MGNTGDVPLFLHRAVFLVNDEPYCLWSLEDIRETTLNFLKNINPTYFDYQADINLKKLMQKKFKQHAALAIRTAYSHGLETLFSLLCVAIQSPHSVPGWLLLCKNAQLYNIVEKIDSNDEVQSLIKQPRLSWQIISSFIHESLVLADKEKEKSIKTRFGDLWNRWASHFLDDAFQKEYNSIKHGFRVKAGGSSFAIGAEETPGVPAPAESMRLMGKSEFGTSYFDYIPVGDPKHHIQLQRNFRNWDPEDMAWSLHLISNSISNIVSCLKVQNGVNATKVKFSWPTKAETFQEPWKRTSSMAVTAIIGFRNIIPPETIINYSKDDLRALYKEGKVLFRKPLNPIIRE